MFFERLGSFARVIRFDRRGSGASDPLHSDALPAWESFAEDIACVMDEVGSEKAFVWGDGEAGPLSLLFAASHPDRVSGLILFFTSARFLADSDYEFGMPKDGVVEVIEQLVEDWGTGEYVSQMVPSRASDPDFVSWMARLMRATATPSSIKKYMEAGVRSDARDALRTIDQPTLVLHPVESELLSIEHSRYVVEHVSNSRLVELPGPPDVYPFFALADQVVSEIQRFVTGAPASPTVERALATVVFTDIVDSTKRAKTLGDRRWKDLLNFHENSAKDIVTAHSGRLIEFTGDGLLATFDGPGRAIRSVRSLQQELARADLHIRTGIHTGEIELRGHGIAGIAVHLAARVMALAGSDEILVTSTLKDLVIGSDLEFDNRGAHNLKGIDGQWQLYSVRSATFE